MSIQQIPAAILVVRIASYCNVHDQLQLATTHSVFARLLNNSLSNVVSSATVISNANLPNVVTSSSESQDFHLGLYDRELLRSVVSSVLSTSNELLSDVENGSCPLTGDCYRITIPDAHWLCSTPHRFEWPMHCSLHFWRHGPGYRGSHYAPIQQNVEYCIFQPDAMVLTNGIWHPHELIEAISLRTTDAKSTSFSSPAATSSSAGSSFSLSASSQSSDLSASSLISAWSVWREKLKSAIEVRASWESDGSQESYNARGLGDATETDRTAAVVDLPINPATGTLYQTFGFDAPLRDFPPLKSLVHWSQKEKQYFLHAWQKLDHVRIQIYGAGARCRFHLYNNDVDANFASPPTERYADALQPVSFLLPWPTDGSAGDTRYAMGGPPRWNSDQRGSITNAMLHSVITASSQSTTNRSPIFDPATAAAHAAAASSNDSSKYSVAGLSSIVRGCPWPLDSTDYSSYFTKELLIVARRVVKLFGVSLQFADPIHIYPQSYCAGPRPVGNENPDRSYSNAIPAQVMFGQDGSICHWPISRLFDNLNGGGATGAAVPLSTLLTSSFIFSFGSEHLVPWPIMIVAPIAPGWVGGFMTAANSFE